jgi:hypothetical protein
LVGVGAGLREIRLAALNGEIQVGRIDLHQWLAGLDVGIVVHQHPRDRTADARADGMNVAFQKGVIGGFKTSDMINIAADARTGDSDDRGSGENFAPGQAASQCFHFDNGAGGRKVGIFSFGGSGGSERIHGGNFF